MRSSLELQKIRDIEIVTRKLSRGALSGAYHTNFKGRGVEFSEVREYVPGDPIRAIDWNVTARMNAPFVKTYQEERELTVMLLVDTSSSMEFGTRRKSKAELSAELCALLAYSAIRNKDKVGLIFFSDRVETYIPPRKGRDHIYRIISELLDRKEREERPTRFREPLRFFLGAQKKRCVCFILSDWIGFDAEKELGALSRHHDLIALSLDDPLEVELPNAGWVSLADAETGALRTVPTSSARFRAEYRAIQLRRIEKRNRTLRRLEVDHCELRVDSDIARELIRFFQRRAGRRTAA